MLLIRDDVCILLEHMLDTGKQLVWEETKTNRLIDV